MTLQRLRNDLDDWNRRYRRINELERAQQKLFFCVFVLIVITGVFALSFLREWTL